MTNELPSATDAAKEAVNEPKIKRHLKVVSLVSRYRENWYKYDDNGCVTHTPSDRMQGWVEEIEDFNNNLDNTEDNGQWDEFLLNRMAKLGKPVNFKENARVEKLWKAYCKFNETSYIIDPSDCLC